MHVSPLARPSLLQRGREGNAVNQRGEGSSSSTAVVAIVVLVMVGIISIFLFLGRGGGGKGVIPDEVDININRPASSAAP
jgi:hypothetical protein